MDIPNYLKEKSPKAKSIKQEKRIAKKGFVTPRSGAYWQFKGDVIQDNYMIEAKRTEAASMSVKEEWLKKTFEDAIINNKEPGIELEFKNYYIQGIILKKKRNIC